MHICIWGVCLHVSTVSVESTDFQSLTLTWYCPLHMTIAVPFRDCIVPGLQPQGGFVTDQEGFCILQKSLERLRLNLECIIIERGLEGTS